MGSVVNTIQLADFTMRFMKVGDAWTANHYINEAGGRWFGVLHPDISNVGADDRPAYRVRVIKRDPSTYLDRLIAAAEYECRRANAAWSTSNLHRSRQAVAAARERYHELLARKTKRPALAKPAVSERDAHLEQARKNSDLATPSTRPASMTDSVADAMLKGIAP